MRTARNAEPDSRGRSFVGHSFGLRPPPDGDQAAMTRAAASWNDAQARTLRANAARIAKLEEARESLRAAVRREVSAEAAQRFRQFSRRERDALRALLRAGDLEERRRAARDAKDRSLRLMNELGVSRERLRALYASSKSDLAAIVQQRHAANRLLASVALKETPQPVRDRVMSGDFRFQTTTSDGLTVFTPPFDGWWWKGSWWRVGGSDPQIDIYPDPATGAIGHRSEWEDGDASDADGFTLDYDTSISAWYNPPHSGVLDVWILATCGSAHYDVWLDDEWGWSDSGTWMRSYITANVSPVIDDEDRVELWQSYVSGSPDSETYIDDPYPPGNVQIFHLTTSQALPGGAWSMLRVGAYAHRFTILNDVSTRQLMRNRWFVNAIFVRTR